MRKRLAVMSAFFISASQVNKALSLWIEAYIEARIPVSLFT